MSTLADRFAALSAAKPLITQADLARATGAKPPSVSAWFSGETKSMKADTAAKAAQLYGCNPMWLSTGIGPVWPANTSDQSVTESTATQHQIGSTMQPILAWEHQDDLPPGEFVMIPRLGIKLSAGNGHEQVEIEFVEKQPQAFRADWIRDKRFKPAKLASMRADGHSMEPRIWDGDALVVDTSQSQVQDGKVYAIWYDGGERVKRLYRLPGGGLRIKSDNPEFGPIELTADQTEHVRVIGRIVHIAGDGGL